MKNSSTYFACAFFALQIFCFQPVDINRASAKQIALVSGVGETLAANIIAHRIQHGPFAGLGDLSRVSGLSAKKLKKIEGQISFSSDEPNAVKTPKSFEESKESEWSPPTADLLELEKHVLAFHGLDHETDRSLISRVKSAAFLPKLQASFEVDRGDWSAKKQIESRDDSLVNRKDRDFSIGVRATFDLDRLIFNRDELEVQKLVLKRLKEREKIITKLHKSYFQYLRLKNSADQGRDLSARQVIKIEMMQLKAQLDSMSGGKFFD